MIMLTEAPGTGLSSEITFQEINDRLGRMLPTGRIKSSGVGHPHVALAITSNAHRSLENTIVNKLSVVVSIDEVNTVVVVAGDPGIPHGIDGYIKGFVQTEIAKDLALFRIAVHKFCNTGGLAIGHPDVALFVRYHSLRPGILVRQIAARDDWVDG